MNVSFYPNVRTSQGTDTTIERWFNRLRSDHHRADVVAYRRAPDPSIKFGLPAITPSARFPGARNRDAEWHHSGLLVYDFDNIPFDGNALGSAQVRPVERLRGECREMGAFGGFRSISPGGLKVLFACNPLPTTPDEHRSAWQTGAELLTDEMKAYLDESGKDVTRLCFASWDPDAFLRTDSSPVTWCHVERERSDFSYFALASLEPHLHAIRPYGYHLIVSVGMALHRESAGSDVGYAMWLNWIANEREDFNKRADFNERELTRKWKSFATKHDGFTGRTIIHYAEQAIREAPPVHVDLNIDL